jgi:hypothetical protein
MAETRAALLAAGFLVACAGPSPVNPKVDEFQIDAPQATELEEAAKSGHGAEGTYVASGGTVKLNLASSTFSCGIQPGTLVATVQSVSATDMLWRFEDGNEVAWTRVDGGTGDVVGVWKNAEVGLYLILSADGTVQLFGKGEVCESDRRRNAESCYELALAPAAITIDGDLADWDAVGPQAALSDEAGDSAGGDPGADLAGLKVVYRENTVYVLMALHHAPSTSFQGGQSPNSAAYRLTIRGKNGLSLAERFAYSPESGTWQVLGDSQSGGFAAAAGPTGIEWSVDVSSYAGAGFTEVSVILPEAIDCGQGCQSLDQSTCGYFLVP